MSGILDWLAKLTGYPDQSRCPCYNGAPWGNLVCSKHSPTLAGVNIKPLPDPREWCKVCARDLNNRSRRPKPLGYPSGDKICEDCFNRPTLGELAVDRAWENNR